MRLLGVDVGFSINRPTTGIAYLDGDTLQVWKARTSWDSRSARIPGGFCPEIIALDGPLMPPGASELAKRRCEQIFARKPFSRRCKPGFSHFGFGLQLRNAAAEAHLQFSRLLGGSDGVHSQPPQRPRIVEAFPNAFLAVLLSDEVFRSMRTLKRGRKFDWLYERAVDNGSLQSICHDALKLPNVVWNRLRVEEDHEKRAALICLLTAGFAAQGSAEKVGDIDGGWFWLPSLPIWHSWASEGLEIACRDRGVRR